MIYVGIDPGVTGAVCVIGKDKHIAFVDTPTYEVKSGKSFKSTLDAPACAEIIARIMIDSNADCYCVIEKVQAMPGKPSFARMAAGEKTQSMGATSAFNFGKGFGIWLGILAAFKMPFEQVHPATWKKQLMAGMSTTFDENTPDSVRKDAGRIRAIELYPNAIGDLKLKKNHGRADALLLAEYGRRTYFGPEEPTALKLGPQSVLFT